MNRRVRAIAFYLPQFHPIPENDEWWGEGFTEWTNVKKATPLFEGHKQPVIPGELGYYDLRDTNVREKQAKLAIEHGIEGFCYWHYWFGDGRRILQHVFEDVLESGKPDFPFCLSWANESWTGIWHGAKDRILIEQRYPGKEDYINHFKFLIKAFSDRRYIRVDDKPLFIVYRPQDIPNILEFVSVFRKEAQNSGLKGLYLVGNNAPDNWRPQEYGFDAVAPTGLHLVKTNMIKAKEKFGNLSEKLMSKKINSPFVKGPFVFEYKDYLKRALQKNHVNYKRFPCIIPNWDNTPRSQHGGWVLVNSFPEQFRVLLRDSIQAVKNYSKDERIVFIKSWNEWAEGNYLEPDMAHGRKYLEVCREEIEDFGQ
ncbi:MAG TPA: glycoside hydrolase family 99-like domain-containing protein [Flavipsychrobacter sp.]|nr:glycoside hydrolase family 99-like domain-containing protein [Flavipsychrobacter sp.]